MLQHKSQKGDGQAVITTPLQQLTDLVAEKHHPVLDGLFQVASQLLTRRRRCTAQQALAEIRALAAAIEMKGCGAFRHCCDAEQDKISNRQSRSLAMTDCSSACQSLMTVLSRLIGGIDDNSSV